MESYGRSFGIIIFPLDLEGSLCQDAMVMPLVFKLALAFGSIYTYIIIYNYI